MATSMVRDNRCQQHCVPLPRAQQKLHSGSKNYPGHYLWKECQVGHVLSTLRISLAIRAGSMLCKLAAPQKTKNSRPAPSNEQSSGQHLRLAGKVVNQPGASSLLLLRAAHYWQLLPLRRWRKYVDMDCPLKLRRSRYLRPRRGITEALSEYRRQALRQQLR
mmetsp:Transcript_148827/g.277425  ORF Transcript_148827/g.277425 Transcript_148827/m.277425 type:complete len:162 (-) Transcript_148827:292-777(-)